MGKKEKEAPDAVAATGKIYFKPIEARDLKGGKRITPYCKVYQDKDKKFQTEPMNKTKDPTWDETARLIVMEEETPVEKVRFVVEHKGTLMTGSIGELSFQLRDLMDGVPRDGWFVLKNKKGTKDMGELHLQLMYLEKDDNLTPQKDEFPYPLQTLLRKGKLTSWAALMETDPDIDKPDRRGQTALHVCAELGLNEQMTVLLNRNASIGIKDEDERTALHCAALAGNTTEVASLLENDAQVNAKDKIAQTPLHVAVSKNQAEVAALLIEKGASVSAQDTEGDTPLHVALQEGSHECISLLVDRGADIYLENAKGLSSCALSEKIAADNEETRNKFFEAINVVDGREFEMKRKYKHRTIVGGTGLAGEDSWQTENPQFLVTGPKDTEIHLIMHYDDPISKTTQPMEKCSFIAFRNQEKQFKELSYWHDNLVYGRLAPVSFTLPEDDASFACMVYSKGTKIAGQWNLVAYSDTQINIAELAPWPHKQTLEAKWADKTAGGCIEHPTFADNPKYVMELPPQKVKLSFSLAQEKNMGDVEPFSVIPYKYHTGLYIFKKDLTAPVEVDPIARTSKFKNSRENNVIFELDGAEHDKVIVIPATFRPGETSGFTLTVASDAEVKLAPLAEIPSA